MRGTQVIVTLASAIAVGTAVYLYAARGVEAPAERSSAVVAEPVAAPAPAPVPAAPAPGASALPPATDTAPASAPSLSERFATATDYLELANSILGRARAGDATAQYYLYAVLSHCDEEFRAFFRRRGARARTLDEALAHESTRNPKSPEWVRLSHQRCSGLFDGGADHLGDAADWLRRATAQRQPMALATTANKLLLRADPIGEPGHDVHVLPNARNEARAMLATAIRSKDADVIWMVGHAQTMLDDGNGDEDELELRQWAWWLAACQRGHDCARWMESSCRFDPQCVEGETWADYIRRATQSNFAEIEARAQQILERIDSEAWEELDLGAPM
jgi:hypothetical protein